MTFHRKRLIVSIEGPGFTFVRRGFAFCFTWRGFCIWRRGRWVVNRTWLPKSF